MDNPPFDIAHASPNPIPTNLETSDVKPATTDEIRASHQQISSTEPRQQPDKSMVHGIRPDELVRLTPKLRPYLQHPNPTWPDIIDAADWLRYDLGISKSLWGDACLTMGRDLAAVALAIVATKDPGHFTGTPGGKAVQRCWMG